MSTSRNDRRRARNATSTEPRARRRQIGTSTDTTPLPTAPAPASARSIGVNRAAIWMTTAAWAIYVLRTLKIELIDRSPSTAAIVPMVGYLIVVTSLTASAVAYLVSRHGFLMRTRQHARFPRSELDATFADGGPTLTVLVPSYREDARVVRQTLLSAAIQEYSDLEIVLLIDDPVAPTDEADRQLLDEAMRLPDEVNALLAGPATVARDALDVFELESLGREHATNGELWTLSVLYLDAAQTLHGIGASLPRVDHTDTFLVEHVIGRLADEFEQVADAVLAAADTNVELTVERVRQLHLRLVRIFSARVTAFQRKRYATLSHEPNKAMNLNSYLSLLGGRYREQERGDAIHLVPVAAGVDADLVIRDAELVLTLDADSVLLPEYCLRLVHIMLQPGNERVAVAQTPYSAFRGAPTRLERLAGASTDLQHRIHQGLTYHEATFWVGANAILRRSALEDISTVEIESGRRVIRYLHDRTVIEDTESSIDLGTHGWTLYNHGERLSYSATPPDFGSLAIQRQRWADGGLIILPKLLRHVRAMRRAGTPVPFASTFLRVNYLASIAWSSVGLLLLLGYPFSERLLSPLVVCAAAPYFLAQAADLHACGYRRLDVVRIYGFNLVLLAVNLAGAMRSIAQAVTGTKIAFARTPKRQNRTSARPLFILAPVALIAFSVYTVVHDVSSERWWHAAFAVVNAATTSWAMLALIGLGAAVADVLTGTVRFVYHVPPERTRPQPPAADWATVLDQGVHV